MLVILILVMEKNTALDAMKEMCTKPYYCIPTHCILKSAFHLFGCEVRRVCFSFLLCSVSRDDFTSLS